MTATGNSLQPSRDEEYRRHPDGSIDYDFYRRAARRSRSITRTRVVRDAALGVASAARRGRVAIALVLIAVVAAFQ